MRDTMGFGDCLTDATARGSGEPLCLGDDFALTGLELVPLGADA